ncbi:receptor-like protein kinase [Gossypium australe]|uniref:Receptor-like protein kinase n=1 Tax=Gossypium australe TaxID=47621 RepID=A0A5B6WQ03_9ROSI|nr:receptor-like protein kinase [Gossypium australe]
MEEGTKVWSKREAKPKIYLTYEKEPLKIVARKVKVLISKWITLVKVLWHNQKTSEATWETNKSTRPSSNKDKGKSKIV